MGLERDTYDTALEVLRDSCSGSFPTIDGLGRIGREPYDYDEKRVELAKWIVKNIWAPVDEAA